MLSLNRNQFAFGLYFFGLILLMLSLPLSKFGMSVAQFMLAAGWLIGGDFKEKFKKFFSSPLALILASVYLMHVIGLLYTSDFTYAFKDLRIKLPLLILPFLLISSPPLTTSQFDKVLLALIAGVAISTLVSLFIYLGIISRPVVDIRDISIFISHIRLVLLCCVSVFAGAWLIHKHRNNKPNYYLVILSPVIVWLVYFVFFIQSLTGMLILIVSSFIILLWIVVASKKVWMRVSGSLVIVILTSGIYSTVKSVNETFLNREEVNIELLEAVTPSGNEYHHYTDRNEFENRNMIWIYLCEEELESEWNKRSKFDYRGKDKRNQELRMTLIRFLTSKGLRKDSAGVATLTSDEIRSVENGIANVLYEDMTSLKPRIHQVLWEIIHVRSKGDPSGHSVTQRLEFWSAAIGIIKENKWTGVGTGDVPAAFSEQYEKTKTRLAQKWRLRSHNQFLSIGVAFGIIGMCWFVFSMVYPIVISCRRRDLLYLSFSLAAFISMLTEDTLETQAGVTFFALFTSLFLFVNPQNPPFGGKKGVL